MQASIASLLLGFAKNNKRLSALLLLNVLLWSFTFPLADFLLGKVVDTLISLKPPLTLATAGYVLVAYLGIYILRNINYFSRDHAISILLPKIKSETVFNLFKHLSGQSYQYFLDRKVSYLSQRLNLAMNGIEPLIHGLFTSFLPPLLALLFAGCFMATVSWYFLAVLWLWSAVVIGYTYFSASQSLILSKKYAQSNQDLGDNLADCVLHINNVIYNAAQTDELNSLKTSIKKMAIKDRRVQHYASRTRLFHGVLSSLLLISMVVLLVVGFNQGQVTVGDFVFIIGLSIAVIGLVMQLGVSLIRFTKHRRQLLDGLHLLKEPHDMTDAADAASHTMKIPSIDIENMHFCYQKPLFENFNLHIKAGEKIGVVGHPGGGKSTLVKLIMRLYDISAGEIKIDGINIKKYTLRSLRQQIAMVPQELELFNRSILENIAYGSGKNAREAIITASKQAHAHEFIMQMPEQYNTLVGEKGFKLSIGQQQRIAIARAILKNSPIILLDEATSALDSNTEVLIQQSVQHLMKNKTTVVIAQRLSTLKAMDRILVIDKGRILESGTHEELIEQGGLYNELWTKQTVHQPPRRTRS